MTQRAQQKRPAHERPHCSDFQGIGEGTECLQTARLPGLRLLTLAWVCDGSACVVPPPLFVLLFCFDTGLCIAQAVLQLTYVAKDGSDHPAPPSQVLGLQIGLYHHILITFLFLQ